MILLIVLWVYTATGIRNLFPEMGENDKAAATPFRFGTCCGLGFRVEGLRLWACKQWVCRVTAAIAQMRPPPSESGIIGLCLDPNIIPSGHY